MQVSSGGVQQSVAPDYAREAALSSNPDLCWFSDEQGAIVIDRTTRQTHVLNTRAALLLLLCDGSRDFGAILHEASSLACTDTDVADNAADNTVCDRQWIEQAIDKRLIESGGQVATTPTILSGKKLRRLAQSLLEADLAAEAKRCALSLVTTSPGKSANWYLLGDIEHALGDFRAAKRAYERYVDLDPDNLTISHLVTALSEEPPPSKAPIDYVRQTFDDYADTFDQSLLEDLGYQTPDLIAKAVFKFLPKAANSLKVADLGCGTGLMAKALASRAGSICGVDLSCQMMSKALSTGLYNEIHVAEITKWLAADDRLFDLILAADVLVYFGALESLFTLARARMHRESIFAFSVEQSNQPGFDLTVTGRYAHHPQYIEGLASNCGLKILSMKSKTLRYEYANPVSGLVVVVKPA